MEAALRRAEASAEVTRQTGLDEATIDRVVRAFYGRVRADPLLGPLFAQRIVEWEPHLRRMQAFWSSVALLTGRYRGQPMEKHIPLPVEAAHFDRWLALFAATAEELYPPAGAALLLERARRIAQSLQLGIAAGRGRMLAPGERLGPPECAA
jgi:hemoglobin